VSKQLHSLRGSPVQCVTSISPCQTSRHACTIRSASEHNKQYARPMVIDTLVIQFLSIRCRRSFYGERDIYVSVNECSVFIVMRSWKTLFTKVILSRSRDSRWAKMGSAQCSAPLRHPNGKPETLSLVGDRRYRKTPFWTALVTRLLIILPMVSAT
jgi:hypothetical protein